MFLIMYVLVKFSMMNMDNFIFHIMLYDFIYYILEDYLIMDELNLYYYYYFILIFLNLFYSFDMENFIFFRQQF